MDNRKQTHEQQLNDVAGFSKKLNSNAEEWIKKAKELTDLITKPIESKVINIYDVPCTAQIFTDRVTVVLPSTESCKKYYNNIDASQQEIKELKKDINDLKIEYRKVVTENYVLNSHWFFKLKNWFKK